MANESRNDVVMVELDRPRELRFGHRALKQILALTGKDIDAFDLDNIDLGEIEKIMYCGLLYDAKQHGETLKLEDMEDLLDQAPSVSYYIQKMQEALSIAFGSLGGTEGNQEKPE